MVTGRRHHRATAPLSGEQQISGGRSGGDVFGCERLAERVLVLGGEARSDDFGVVSGKVLTDPVFRDVGDQHEQCRVAGFDTLRNLVNVIVLLLVMILFPRRNRGETTSPIPVLECNKRSRHAKCSLSGTLS